MGRTLVMGDVHGAYKALRQVLDRAAFDPKQDSLICLGDVCDRGPDTKECINTLLQLDHLVYVLGNHDAWALEWMKTRIVDPAWARQGGLATMASYLDGIPEPHIEFLSKAPLYHVDENRLFVHAGIDPSLPLTDQTPEILLWDREMGRLVLRAYLDKNPGKVTDFNEVYIGHTPIPFQHPIQAFEVWMLDTGAGWSGVLSLMDIDSKAIFTSDPIPSLYGAA